MANKNEMVHLDISEAEKGTCELCKEEGGLVYTFDWEKCKAFMCHFCGHRESFHMANGKRKEKPIFSRYL